MTLINVTKYDTMRKKGEEKYPLPDDLPTEDQRPFITQPFYILEIHAV